jgi:NAD(P)-dependent dehydrogenase (short-subunit alcohol dehydrogenase family)
MSLFDLKGRVAVITGSSRGIGRAVAERLAEHGAKVVISSRSREATQAVADAINAKHGSGAALAVAANISSKEDLTRLVESARAAFGKIDILVCNAATNVHFGSMSTITDAQFRKILDNNIL